MANPNVQIRYMLKTYCEWVAELDPGAPRKFFFFFFFCVVHRSPRHALEVQLFQYGFTRHEESLCVCTAYMVPYIELMPSVTLSFFGHDFIKHSTLFPSGSSHRTHSSLPYMPSTVAYRQIKIYQTMSMQRQTSKPIPDSYFINSDTSCMPAKV